MSKSALSQEPELVLSPPRLSDASNEWIAGKTSGTAIVLPLYSPLDKKENAVLKRLIDVAISSIILVLVFPWLIPIMALIIKLDSKGPVFFIQKRIKKNGAAFSCIKFRTMRINENADTEPAMENDQRITRIGRFLRLRHLDELPQMINVLVGDISLIGPRPYMVYDNEKFERMVADYHLRYRVKPGITGMAQVSGLVGYVAELKDLEKRVEQDTYYVQNWTLGLDLKIMLKTFYRMLKIGIQ